MEAIPRLPMLSFELKSSPEYVDFGPVLKQYIRDQYGEDPAHYNKACSDLEQLRQNAVHVSHDFMGCSTLKKYYAQLQFLQGRFPMTEGGQATMPFTWDDIFMTREVTLADIKFEQASVLYNIGSLHSVLGAMETRNSADGMKVACTHFQCAAWAYEYLRDHFGSALMSNDFSHELLTFHVNLMLAQAQECILEKSMIDSRKSSITAKVAIQIVDFSNAAMKALDITYSDGIVSSRRHKEWKKRIEIKVLLYQSITNFYMGKQSEEQQKWGECLAYYELANKKLQECAKVAKGETSDIQESLRFANDVIGGKYQSAKKDNDFVYHEKVPDPASLPEVKGASLVKGIPFNPNDPEISGPDLFQKLVPMEAHEASSLYSEEKAKLMREVCGEIEEKDTRLSQFMSSLNLDDSKLNFEPEKLPQELLEKCAAVSVKQDAIKNLIDSMTAVSNLATEVEMSLKEVSELLENESMQEEEFQKQFGKRDVNPMFEGIGKELSKFEEGHRKGSQSNNDLHKAMNAHITNLRLLGGPIEDIRNALPSIEKERNPDDEGIAKELQRLLSKVKEMQEQRAMLQEQFRTQVRDDDITSVLVTQEGGNKQVMFDNELKKHEKTINLIQQNLSAQEKILSAMTSANAKYATVRQSTDHVSDRRDAMIRGLINSYEVYEDLLAKSQRGQEFYKKLEGNVKRILARCRGLCKIQAEEREQILARFKPKVPVPSRPTAPKPQAPQMPQSPQIPQAPHMPQAPQTVEPPQSQLQTPQEQTYPSPVVAPQFPTIPSFDGPKLKDYLPFMKPKTFGKDRDKQKGATNSLPGSATGSPVHLPGGSESLPGSPLQNLRRGDLSDPSRLANSLPASPLHNPRLGDMGQRETPSPENFNYPDVTYRSIPSRDHRALPPRSEPLNESVNSTPQDVKNFVPHPQHLEGNRQIALSPIGQNLSSYTDPRGGSNFSAQDYSPQLSPDVNPLHAGAGMGVHHPQQNYSASVRPAVHPVRGRTHTPSPSPAQQLDAAQQQIQDTTPGMYVPVTSLGGTTHMYGQHQPSVPGNMTQRPSLQQEHQGPVPSSVYQSTASPQQLPGNPQQLPGNPQQFPSNPQQLPRNLQKLPGSYEMASGSHRSTVNSQPQLPSNIQQLPASSHQLPTSSDQFSYRSQQLPNSSQWSMSEGQGEQMGQQTSINPSNLGYQSAKFSIASQGPTYSSASNSGETSLQGQYQQMNPGQMPHQPPQRPLPQQPPQQSLPQQPPQQSLPQQPPLQQSVPPQEPPMSVGQSYSYGPSVGQTSQPVLQQSQNYRLSQQSGQLSGHCGGQYIHAPIATSQGMTPQTQQMNNSLSQQQQTGQEVRGQMMNQQFMPQGNFVGVSQHGSVSGTPSPVPSSSAYTSAHMNLAQQQGHITNPGQPSVLSTAGVEQMRHPTPQTSQQPQGQPSTAPTGQPRQPTPQSYQQQQWQQPGLQQFPTPQQHQYPQQQMQPQQQQQMPQQQFPKQQQQMPQQQLPPQNQQVPQQQLPHKQQVPPQQQFQVSQHQTPQQIPPQQQIQQQQHQVPKQQQIQNQQHQIPQQMPQQQQNWIHPQQQQMASQQQQFPTQQQQQLPQQQLPRQQTPSQQQHNIPRQQMPSPQQQQQSPRQQIPSQQSLPQHQQQFPRQQIPQQHQQLPRHPMSALQEQQLPHQQQQALRQQQMRQQQHLPSQQQMSQQQQYLPGQQFPGQQWPQQQQQQLPQQPQQQLPQQPQQQLPQQQQQLPQQPPQQLQQQPPQQLPQQQQLPTNVPQQNRQQTVPQQQQQWTQQQQQQWPQQPGATPQQQQEWNKPTPYQEQLPMSPDAATQNLLPSPMMPTVAARPISPPDKTQNSQPDPVGQNLSDLSSLTDFKPSPKHKKNEPPSSSSSVTERKMHSRQHSTSSNTSFDDILSSNPVVPQETTQDGMLTPKVLTAQEIQQQKEEAMLKSSYTRQSSKDPYSDPLVKDRFVGEVEKFAKSVESLTKAMCSGPSNLDLYWKELIEEQEKGGKKASMAIARCYPAKNRDQDIMPYDSTRVKLVSTKDDYINASWITELSPSCPKFISTQLPLAVTIVDFWTMVYEQGSEVIVMLTSETETGKKYPEYWPSQKGQMEEYGAISLTLQSVKDKNNWIERIIHLNHRPTNQGRTIVQLQYNNWPISGFPENISYLLQFITEVHSFYRQQRSLLKPVIIHCSNGIGRTGVFMLIYTGMQEMDHGMGIINIPEVAKKMFQQRRFAVKEKGQLKYVYDAMLFYAQDILAKQGILVRKASFGDRLPHPGEKTNQWTPKEDVLFGTQLSISALQSNVARLGLSELNTVKSSIGDESDVILKDKETETVISEERTLSENLPDVVQRTDVQQSKTKDINIEPSREETVNQTEIESSSSGILIEDIPPANTVDQVNTKSDNSSEIIMDSLSGAEQEKKSSLSDLQNPQTFTLGTSDKSKKKITKDSFLQPNSSLTENLNDPADPLSNLNPLWSLNK